jgi:hypothetical protein
MAIVTIPRLLTDASGGTRRAEVSGANLAEIIRAWDRLYPGIERRILDDDKILPYVMFTIDGAIAAQGLASAVGPQSEVRILPSMGGG